MSSQQRDDARVVTRSVGTGGEVLAKVTERVRQLRSVDDPGVLTPVGVGVAEGDQVVVRLPWLDGVDLAELETRRGPLSAGECVWLGVRVARALEHMHAQGIAHGDISPSNVVLVAGEVVLVDTVAGCLDDELGTVGFRAPERETGGATSAGDVYSLGALLRWAVADSQRMPIEAWTAPLVVREPGDRPPVQISARALASCAPEQAIVVPARSEIVTAVRARASERTVRIPAGRASRLRRLGLRIGLGVAVVAALTAMAVAVPRLLDAAKPAGANAAQDSAVVVSEPAVSASPSPPSPPPTTSPSPLPGAAIGPGEAAAALTQQRIEALAAGDADQLLATVGDGPLEQEVATLSAALRTGELSYEGLVVEVGDVEVVAALPDSAVVRVSYDVSDHLVITPAGEQDVAAHRQRVELDLSWDGQWRVLRARQSP